MNARILLGNCAHYIINPDLMSQILFCGIIWINYLNLYPETSFFIIVAL